MRPKRIAAALLAGLVVSAVSAQSRTTVQSASDNHQALRYRVTAQADGGTTTEDLLQDASDLCRASRRTVESAETRFYASGTPNVAAVKALIAIEAADCAAFDTLRASVDQAKAAFDGAKTAHGCAYLRACPDGGP